MLSSAGTRGCFRGREGSVVEGGNTTFVMRSVAGGGGGGGRCESLPAKSLSKVLACEKQRTSRLAFPLYPWESRSDTGRGNILTREEILALRTAK
jgi:hypothetical protein